MTMKVAPSLVSDEPKTVPEEIQRYENSDPWYYNKLLNDFEYRTGATYLRSYPVDVVLPMVNTCNAKCRFCLFCRYDHSFLEPENLYAYSDILKYVCYFGFSGYGEPLLHPRFENYLSTVHSLIDKRAKTYLVTNGILLEHYLSMVMQYCDTVTISLNSATAETHSKIMGVSNRIFGKIIEQVKNIIELRQAADMNLPQVQLACTVVSENLEEVPAFIDLAHELRVDRVSLGTLAITNRSNIPIDHSDYERLHPASHPSFDRLLLSIKEKIAHAPVEVIADIESWSGPIFFDQLKADLPARINRCSYLYKRLLVLDKHGTVRPCCYMSHFPGAQASILTSDSNLNDVWNGTGMSNLRKALASNKPKGLCRLCVTYGKNVFQD